MDDNFFNELEASLTNVGANTFWKKKVGEVVLWIAPLTMVGQGKVVEVVTSADPKSNIVGETKRLTLAHSIVGINDLDFRSYRDGPPVFPSLNRERKPVKVTLDMYLYNKIAGWGSQFVDDAFSVYADLMESFQKQNLKDVKFENTKDPREELAEYMAKVAELRDQLGLKPLIDPEEQARLNDLEPEEAPSIEEAEMPEAPVPPLGFNPFESVPDRTKKIMEAENLTALQDPQDVKSQRGAVAAPPPMQPVGPIPVPVLNRPGVPGPVYQAMPSVADDVIEERSERRVVPVPELDRPPTNRNPRFNPPPR